MIRNLVSCELAYINTSHPQFIGGNRAIAQVRLLLRRAVLRCVVLCCAASRCAALRCVALCCTALRRAVLCCAALLSRLVMVLWRGGWIAQHWPSVGGGLWVGWVEREKERPLGAGSL